MSYFIFGAVIIAAIQVKGIMKSAKDIRKENERTRNILGL